jgi:transcription antitermination factor NusG
MIQILRRREADPPRPLQRGEKVIVLAEPFRSLEAVFDRRLNAAGRVSVLLEIVNRMVRVDLPETQVQRSSGHTFT